MVGCASSQVPLSNAELQLSKQLALEYQCEVEFQHDYVALKSNRKNGVFWIQLKSINNDLCSKDSSSLKKIAADITARTEKILSHKQSYISVTLNFKTTTVYHKQGYSITCDKDLNIDLADLNNVHIIYWDNGKL
ncbi:hypothetical protein DCM91_14160 [Chitinophaga costaii]|nr:hypothetical protein DCM91_14160 [Chitinophaga costaii]